MQAPTSASPQLKVVSCGSKLKDDGGVEAKPLAWTAWATSDAKPS
jgi:hypothetical protein